MEVEDFQYATSEPSQTTFRSVFGQAELDELLADRERINHRLREGNGNEKNTVAATPAS